MDDEAASKLVEKVQMSEIKDVLFSIDDDKALGPDGFSSCFFKKCWYIVGEDVKKVVEFYFILKIVICILLLIQQWWLLFLREAM